MSRYRGLLLSTIVALVAATFSGRAVLWAVFGVLLALSLIAPAWAWLNINWLRVSRRASASAVQAGEWFEESFRIVNLSILPRLWLEVVDYSSLPNYAPSRPIALLAGRSWRGWRAGTTCAQRGAFTLGPLEVRSSDPLGFFEIRRRLPHVGQVLVLPYTAPLGEVALANTAGFNEAARARRSFGDAVNAAGVREYAVGDSLNRIHWPSTARRQKLIAKEFEQDSLSDIWIALDTDEAVHFTAAHATPAGNFALLPPSTEEYAVALAASLARHFIERHHAVGLIAWSEHRIFIPAERGMRQLRHVLEQLALLRVKGDMPFARVITDELGVLPRSAAVIAISPSPHPEWARALHPIAYAGRAVLAAVIERSSFGDAQGVEAVLAAFAHPGIAVRVVRYGQPFAEALQALPR
ncbi:MAG: DUF58 domain-containing protein [Anaerolineae bacterium]|nr:DUF58 domain-containing protein [Anaerolineae bacterium]